ncbi:MAG: ribonuclease III [Pseudomonadota bacterium]
MPSTDVARSKDASFDSEALSTQIGYRFDDATLLREALTHPSVDPSDRGTARFGYERLEFLGDRVVGLVIAQWLLDRYPSEHEGQIAKRFVAMVRKEALAWVAENLDLGAFLLMSEGEAEAGGRDKDAILADACEALIGAIYRDGGLGAAETFIRAQWHDLVEQHAAPPQDPKTALQEWAQARGLPLPHYETTGREGPDHAPSFTVAASVKGWPSASAEGASKREAAKLAARALLTKLTTAGR